VANRTGDVPIGVTVADPAGVPPSASTSTPAPPVAGPVLDGAYRFDFDLADQTVDGAPTTGDTKKETHWWAFRSSCTSTRCVATGAALADNNQQEPSGSSLVLQFIDGGWQTTPYLQYPKPCNTGYGGGGAIPAGNSADSSTLSNSLQPQADGTLHGVVTTTALTDECGHHGNVYKTPIVATRIGNVPPAVVLADPALFLS
jgi:serine/threonine-protein kinase